jgi:hypothetical protein
VGVQVPSPAPFWVDGSQVKGRIQSQKLVVVWGRGRLLPALLRKAGRSLPSGPRRLIARREIPPWTLTAFGLPAGGCRFAYRLVMALAFGVGLARAMGVKSLPAWLPRGCRADMALAFGVGLARAMGVKRLSALKTVDSCERPGVYNYPPSLPCIAGCPVCAVMVAGSGGSGSLVGLPLVGPWVREGRVGLQVPVGVEEGRSSGLWRWHRLGRRGSGRHRLPRG